MKHRWVISDSSIDIDRALGKSPQQSPVRATQVHWNQTSLSDIVPCQVLTQGSISEACSFSCCSRKSLNVPEPDLHRKGNSLKSSINYIQCLLGNSYCHNIISKLRLTITLRQMYYCILHGETERK